jgi:uncharacterized membrane protein YccF (DUF307 family)
VREVLNLVLNILWLVLAGFWMSVGYAIAGVICCLLIITIPFGIASFRMANYAFWPFGRTVVKRPEAGVGSAIGNVLWLILAGWWLALGHVITGIALCITIIGIPLGIANFKLVPVSLLPMGREIVSTGEPRRFPAPAVREA